MIHGFKTSLPRTVGSRVRRACGRFIRRCAATRRRSAFEWFETKVRPILVDHCYTCHSADTKPAGGLRVDDRNGLLAGGNSGPADRARRPGGEPVAQAGEPQEPESADAQGGPAADRRADRRPHALDPRRSALAAGEGSRVARRSNEWYEPLKKEHWAWQPLTNPELAGCQRTLRGRGTSSIVSSWPGSRRRGSSRSKTPTGSRCLRRVTFDLTGLPPTPDEIDAFLKDASPDAFARVVDGLLASPQFGERWGQHWLDVARYADSTGPSRNIPYPHAWKYRDYVIDAVNADVPFDRFVTEQIAGDLLPASSAAERDRLLIATGFLALGVKDVNQRFKVRFVMDNVDDQIDAVSRSMLGLTVTCARCHDHKFDPIPTTDYYALAGIFTSTDNCAGLRNKMGGGGLDYYDPSMLVRLSGDAPAPPEQQVRALEAKVAEAKKAWDAIRGTPEGLAKGPNGVPVQRPVSPGVRTAAR